MFGGLLRMLGLGGARPARREVVLRQSYDAAASNDDNRRHWANADSYSARAANSKEVRQRLRDRSRYEVANNSYARGIVNTLSNHVVGTTPRLQVTLENRDQSTLIEKAFQRWAKAIGLADKLRTLMIAQIQDGEAFGILTTNKRLRGVQLDVKLVEAEQVTSPLAGLLDPLRVDGIDFDSDGNVSTYWILPTHPGDALGLADKPVSHDADKVLHLFRPDRPGQVRGVPEIMPALPLFAQLRRFTLATIAAAETAADFAGVLQTTGAASDTPEVDPWQGIEIEKRGLVTLPEGWEMGQFKAEHPTTTYEMFKAEIISEAARCLHMPFNIAACNSSSYNYSSGRLDHQTYYADIDIRRSRVEVILDRIFLAWLDEALLIDGVLPANLGPLLDLDHYWQWDAPAHIDEQKEANAQLIRLGAGMTSFQLEFAREGLDCDTEQKRMAESLGLTLDEYRARLADKILGPSPEMVTDQEDGTVIDPPPKPREKAKPKARKNVPENQAA